MKCARVLSRREPTLTMEGPMTAAAEDTAGPADQAATGRANQKARTRRAIVDACRELTRSGAEVTMPDVAGSADPAERVGFACAYLIRGVHAYQGSVRAMISHTIVAPAQAQARPGIRFGLLDYALAPFADPAGPAFLPPAAMARLKQQLAVVVSAEALFVLTDLCGLSLDGAIAAAVPAAETLTRAAFGSQAAG